MERYSLWKYFGVLRGFDFFGELVLVLVLCSFGRRSEVWCLGLNTRV